MSVEPLDPKSESYNEEMRQWMAKQSFWYRLRYLRRHPEARSLPVSILTVFLKLVPVLGVGALGYYMLLQRYLSRADFNNLLKQEVAVVLGATDVELLGGKWKAQTVSINSVQAKGRPESWLRQVELVGLQFKLPMSKLFKPEWTPMGVSVQKMNLELKESMLGPKEIQRLLVDLEAQEAEARRVLEEEGVKGGRYEGGFGVKCDGTKFMAQNFFCRNANISWGGKGDGAGSVEGALFSAKRQEAGWLITLKGGKFSHGWLRDVNLEEASLYLGKERFLVQRLIFTVPAAAGRQEGGGQGAMAGEVMLGEKLQLNLTSRFLEIEASTLLPEEFAGLFVGKLRGECRMSGVSDGAEGLRTEGELNLMKGFSFGIKSAKIIPLIEVLGGDLPDVGVRYFTASDGGGVQFSLSPEKFTVEGLTWVTEDGERIEGQFTLRREDKRISGVFRVGVKPGALTEYPVVAKRYFTEERGGLRWMNVTVDNEYLRGDGETVEEEDITRMTSDLAEEIRALRREKAED